MMITIESSTEYPAAIVRRRMDAQLYNSERFPFPSSLVKKLVEYKHENKKNVLPPKKISFNPTNVLDDAV